ncbi:MAG: hypothetical protein ABI988_10240 [Nitrospirota bacterium]
MMIERVPSQFQFKQANLLVVGDETSLLTLRHTVPATALPLFAEF